MRDVRARSEPWLVAAPPAVLTLVVSFIGIGRYGLGNDEYATWYASTLSFPDLFRLLDHQDALLGPFYLAMHPWLELAGESAGHMRAPSAAAMAGAAALIALLGRRLFDPWTGLGAGLMFAGVPSTSAYGQEARPYAVVVAATLLAALLLLRAIESPSWRRWAGYAGAVVLVALAHIVALTVLAAHAALVWRDARAGQARCVRRWFVATAVPLVFMLPVMAKGLTQKDAVSWLKADAATVRGLPGDLFGSPVVALLVIALALVASVAMARVDRRPLVLLLTWAVVPPLFCYLTFPVLHIFHFRYVLFIVPAWVLLAAALPRALAGGTSRRWPVVAGALVLPVVVGLVGLPDQEEARRLPLHEPDFAPAARVVQAHLRDGDGIVFAQTRRDGRRAFAYLHVLGVVGAPKDVLRGRPASEIGWFRPTECLDTVRCLAGTNRVWLIADAEPGPDRVEGISQRAQVVLGSEFDRELVGSARQIKVYLLKRAAR